MKCQHCGKETARNNFERDLGWLKQWLVDGLSIKQIATQHGVTATTVRAGALKADERFGFGRVFAQIKLWNYRNKPFYKNARKELLFFATCHEADALAGIIERTTVAMNRMSK